MHAPDTNKNRTGGGPHGEPGIKRRTRCEKLFQKLKNERASWESHWQELADYIAPHRYRYQTSEHNQGKKRRDQIIDPHATMSHRTLASGMMTGITSPARPWFRLATPDQNIMEDTEARRWLYVIEQRIRDVMLRSNMYNALGVIYEDVGTFATGALGIFEDAEDVIRAYAYPVGSYWASTNDRGNVDTFARQYRLTVRQCVNEFGYENCSSTTREMWDNGDTENYRDVVHLIYPNPEWKRDRLESRFKRYASKHWETSSNEADQTSQSGQFLRESGYDEFPILVPRWQVTGEDVYGTNSPGMQMLGDIKSLQLLVKHKLLTVEKQVNPPLIGTTNIRGHRVSQLPGEITYVSTRDMADGGVRTLHEVNLNIGQLQEVIAETKQNISRGYYEDLFLMLAQSDRRQITATEIDERREEKLLMLGPVLERLNDDLLDPMIDRIFAIMNRMGLFPDPPESLEGVDLRVEYISIMAQAQRMVGLAGVDRMLLMAGQTAQINPDVLDKVNIDETVDLYADMLGVPPDMIRSEEEVLQMRTARAQQQAAEQQMAMAREQAETAKTLGTTPLNDGGTALDALMNTVTPGAPLV